MLLMVSDTTPRSHNLSLAGLLLKAKARKGQYTRIGVFDTSVSSTLSSVEGFLKLPGLYDESHYRSIKTDETGKKSYVITLV
jgi:hypothetical protein